MNPVDIIRLLDAAITLAINSGLNWQKFAQMKAEAGGQLTDEQLEELAGQLRDTIGRM